VNQQAGQVMVSPDRILAMEKAIEDHALAKVRLLLKAGVPANHVYQPTLGWSFAWLAAHVGDFPIFCCLIDAGADINARGTTGTILLEAACSRQASAAIVAKVLAESARSQADLDETLLYAPEFGHLEIVEQLLAAGANPRYANEEGATALMHAVMHRQSAIALRLLAAGADPARRIPYEEHYKKTILEAAAVHQMEDFVRACGNPAPAPGIPQPLPTLADAVRALEEWLHVNAPAVQLAPPCAAAALPAPFAAAADLSAWFRRHDGSNGVALVPMADDISYALLPLAEALQERARMLQLFASEGRLPDVPPEFWQETWLPIAGNGAGDYLVWDAATGGVLRFSHETRRTTPRAGALDELFRDLAQGLRSGKYTYSTTRGVT